MLFNSYIFIFVFLPLTLCGYYGLHRLGSPVLAKIELILMSFWFYGYFNPSYLWIMCSSILVNYMLSQLLQKKWKISGKKLQMLKNGLLCVGLFFNLGLIFYFKYYDFFVENLNKVFSADFQLRHVVLPLGISFFTFQQISYMVDSWRGETKEYNFVDYALFVTFFPQLIAGPIVLHNEILPQFEDKKNWKIQWDNLAHGAYIFAAGLVKKVVIADTLSSAVAWGYGHLGRNLTSAEAIITMLAYTFQIYFDFSGYCDMATGLGYLFNIHIPMNFNSPYKATSVVDFWKRWHLTLTRFLRTYVYFPLGGSRKGEKRTYINIIAGVSCERAVAWGKLDIYFMGISAWNRKCTYPYVPKTVGTSAHSDSMGHYVSVCKSYLDIFPGGFHFTGSEFCQTHIRTREALA